MCGAGKGKSWKEQLRIEKSTPNCSFACSHCTRTDGLWEHTLFYEGEAASIQYKLLLPPKAAPWTSEKQRFKEQHEAACKRAFKDPVLHFEVLAIGASKHSFAGCHSDAQWLTSSWPCPPFKFDPAGWELKIWPCKQKRLPTPALYPHPHFLFFIKKTTTTLNTTGPRTKPPPS